LKYIFGPVISRRLGVSLGVDIIPYKTCCFDCIYCQLGRTQTLIVERKSFCPFEGVIRELEEALKGISGIDYITFSGSGEPTLNRDIGRLIREVKEISDIPVAVLTNGALLYEPLLREELMEADLVLPSLDAACEDIFLKVNRPHPSIKLEDVIGGIGEFCRGFGGKVYLEVMLVGGVNDTQEHIQQLSEVISRINPEKIHINTVVRAPCEEWAKPADDKTLAFAKEMFGEKAEIIAERERKEVEGFNLEDKKEALLALLRRRPVALDEICRGLGLHRNEAIKLLEDLGKEGLVQEIRFEGKVSFAAREG